MWKRQTLHECASELNELSREFRAAYFDPPGPPYDEHYRTLVRTSNESIEVLQAIARFLRDVRALEPAAVPPLPVGAYKNRVGGAEVLAIMRDYRPPYHKRPDYLSLGLRGALNRIPHASPARHRFFADENTHDLILTGANNGDAWIAIISLIDLCTVVESLPDVRMVG